MKTWLVGALVVSLAATFTPMSVDAKRLGGGKSTGMQRDMPSRTAPDAPPAKPAAPVQGAQSTAAAAPAAAGATAAATAKRSWMGPIAGLAAGLGLAALMSHLGLGEAFANFLMLALLAVAAFFLIRFLLSRFAGNAGPRPAMGGAHGGSMPEPSPQRAAEPSFERSAVQPAAHTAPAPATAGIEIGSNLQASGSEPAADEAVAPVRKASVPADFDAAAFERVAKMIFIRLQAANDAGDLNDLRQFTTPEMFAMAKLDIQERGPSSQHTDVVSVDAEVLDVAEEDDRQVVSVRFHGSLREAGEAVPVPFDEVWHLVKPVDNSRSWAIAGIEQTH